MASKIAQFSLPSQPSFKIRNSPFSKHCIMENMEQRGNCIYFPSNFQKKKILFKDSVYVCVKWDYKTKKHKGCLCGSAHCLYPDIMKLCIQTPVVKEFHTRMGTVNTTTMNVGRLLHKGQLSHREGWQVDRGPTNE